MMGGQKMAQLEFQVETGKQLLKAAPSVTGTAFTFVSAADAQIYISIAVGVLTLVYTALQIAFLINKWRKKEAFYANQKSQD